MEYKRPYAIGLLVIAYALYVYGLHNALIVFGPIPVDGSLDNPNSHLYRNVYSHVPINVAAFTAFTLTLVFSIMYLWKRDLRYDLIASSAAKLGLLFATFTLLTGMIWAKPTWNSYWNWDPRETTVLILWFAYAGYFALRAAVEEVESRARLSAVLGIFGYATMPLVYWSTKVTSLHPQTGTYSLPEPLMRMNIGLMITAMLLIFAHLLWLEIKIKELENEARKTN